MNAAAKRTFASLSIPNYRRFFSGQVVSITGNWMQMVAEMWLVVQLTGSGVSVGLTAGLQFLPMMILGPWGGLLADRVHKRRLLMITQSLMVIPALALWGLTAGGAVEVWMVYALVLVRGTLNSMDNPARQSFAIEMVGPDRVVNAVALNSMVIHVARILGPAFAGAMIAFVGVSTCFLVNALSFAAMLVALRRIDPRQLQSPPEFAPRGRGQLRSGVRHVAETPTLWIPLAMMSLVGILAFNFQVLLPLLATFTWHGTATTYAALTAAMGIGSVIGAAVTGSRGRVGPRVLVGSCAAFGFALLLVAAAPTLPLQLAALVPLGLSSIVFSAGVNSAMQLEVDPTMRGRVMSLFTLVFMGTTPIGAPFVGWIAEEIGPRAGFVIGAAAALTAAAAARVAYARFGYGPAMRVRRESRLCESSSRTRTARRPLVHETRP